MNIYIINISLIIIYSLIELILYDKNKKTSKVTKTLFFIAFFQLFFIMTFRSHTLGSDGEAYLKAFNISKGVSWREIFNLRAHSPIFNFERGFIFLSKIISTFTGNYTVYLGIMSLIILVPVFSTLSKNSKLPMLSVFLYISLNFFHFSISGIRQAIAFSLVLYSYNFLKNNKNFKFIIIILLAATMHKSAIVFIIALFIRKIKFDQKYIIPYFISFVFVFLFREQLFYLISNIYYGEGREPIITSAYNLLILNTFIVLNSFVFYSYLKNKNKDYQLVHSISTISPLLMIFNTVSTTTLRLANYFFIYSILLIPTLIYRFDKKSRYLIILLVIFSLATVYYLSGQQFLDTGNYKFFWEV